jgi:hypothetical protein
MELHEYVGCDYCLTLRHFPAQEARTPSKSYPTYVICLTYYLIATTHNDNNRHGRCQVHRKSGHTDSLNNSSLR